jgi:hypothetical protein
LEKAAAERFGHIGRETIAEPHIRVMGKCGAKLKLSVRFHAGRKQLPIVRLRKVA